MRTLLGPLVAMVLACGACTSSPGVVDARPSPTGSQEPAVSLASAGIDWSASSGRLEAADPPPAPTGFDEDLYVRMTGILQDWAQRTTLDEDVRYSPTPIDRIVTALPDQAAAALRAQVAGAVSPRLAVANVFGDEVSLVGAPRVTTAWRASTETDDAGQPYIRLELQTRAAYEVRLGDEAPTRVVGVLRVHGLSAYRDTVDDFGVSGGWQEFGALDCALAFDDYLVPDDNLDAAARELVPFVEIGAGGRLQMPRLGAEDRVDAEYLQRCRNGQT